MKQEGKVVSISKLVKWFGLAKSTLYYRAKTQR
jgi:hypothetical protein